MEKVKIKIAKSSNKKDKTGEVKIKLVKSLNGRHKTHIATAKSLGLKKIGDETVQPDNPQTGGKIAQISYLVEVN